MAIKYRLIADKLKEYIKTSPSFTGKLPSENELMKQFNVSRQTIRQALSLLTEKGIIEKHQGKGSFYTGLDEDSKNNIALIFTNDSDYLYAQTTNSISNLLHKSGFNCETHISEYSFIKEAEILRSLLKDTPKGLIIEPFSPSDINPNIELLNQLEKKGCKVVALGIFPGDNLFTCINPNVNEGINYLVKHIMNQGHSLLGSLFHSDSDTGRQRYKAYISAIENSYFESSESLCCWFDNKDLINLRKNNNLLFLQNYITSLPRECTAILCHNDEIAYNLVKAMSLMNINKSRFTLFSFDGSYLSKSKSANFFSLTLKNNEIAETVCDLITKKIRGNTVKSIYLSYKI